MSNYGVSDISCDADKLVDQSIDTVQRYVSGVTRFINHAYGKEYAKEHPELVGHLVMACAIDYHAAMTRVLSTEIRQSLEGLAHIISEHFGEKIDALAEAIDSSVTKLAIVIEGKE